MKLRQFGFKIISLIMVLSMLLGISATMISATVDGAEDHAHEYEKNEINYVSLGASNTNGFGLEGYLPDEQYGNPVNKNDGTVYGYMMEPEMAYPTLVADRLEQLTGKKVVLNQLAISSMRAEELHVLLDNNYYGDKYTEWRFTSGHNWFNKAHPDGLDGLRKEYQDFVANADYITVDIGANNFGVYASNRIFNNMFDADFTKFDEGTQRDVERVRAEIEKIVSEYAGDVLSSNLGDMFNHMVDTLTYALVGFCVNFDASMEAIYELNPDANVAVVNIQNLMHDLKATIPGVEGEIPFGDIYGAIVNLANVYVATMSPYADKYNYAYIGDDGQAETFLEEIKAYSGNPEDLRTAITDCFDVYDNDIYAKTRVLQQVAIKYVSYVGVIPGYDKVSSINDLANLNVFSTAVYDNAVTLAGIPVQEFLTAGAANQLPAAVQEVYNEYKASLLTVYDTAATFMQLGAKSDVLDIASAAENFSQAGKEIMNSFFNMLIYSMSNPGIEVENTEAFQTLANDPASMAIITLGVRSDLGNSFFSHPSENGHVEIANSIMAAYTNDILGSDVVIENVIDIAKQLGDLLVENYDVVYEIAYAELKKNGVIDDLKGKLEGAYSDLISQAEKYESADASSIYAETKVALAAELRATADTVAKIIEIIDQNTIGEHTRVLFAELRESILQHGYVIVNIANELGELSVEYTDQVISDLISAANTAAARLKAAAEAKLAELEAKLHAAEEAAKAAIRAEIEKVKAQLAADLAALDAQIEKQIASVRAECEAIKAEVENIVSVAKSIIDFTAEIKNKMDETIVDFFRNNIGDVYYNFAQTVVDAAKNYIINGKVENFDEALKILKPVVMEALEDASAEVKAIVETFIEEAVKVSYTSDADSYLVSLNGGSAYYAQLLAELLSLDEDQIGFTSWENIDYDMLASAYLITIGYDENELSGFAVNQLIGYLANYVDTDVRENTIAYISALVAKLQEKGINIEKYEGTLVGSLESVLDEFVKDKEMQDMDWAAIVGAENLHYVDKARADIRAELISSGLMETYVIELNVIDLIYDNVDSLGDPALSQIFKTFGREFVANILGESAIYTIEIPVADAVVFAAESFLYNYVNFNVNYGKLILELQKINPEASVLLLGYYNAFNGLTLELGDLDVNVGDVYQMFTDITSVQPFLYALYYTNVAYVDISKAETNFEAYVKAGLVDNDLVSFLTLYLSDPTVTDISFDGQEYVLNQILNALIINCVHEYDNACDVDCNKCGMIRVVPAHAYTDPCDATCNSCGFVRSISGHTYDSCEDTMCNLCGLVRPAGQHTYDGCTDTNCNKCGKTRPAGQHVFNGCVDADCDNCGATRVPGVHEYETCDDTSCNKCGHIRPAATHNYTDCTDIDCNNCGAEREAGEHIYDGCTDADCNNCGASRESGEHEYDSCTDNTCDKCGFVRSNANHKFANACDKDCDNCGETREVPDHVYSDCVDASCNVCGEARTAGNHTLDDCSDTLCDVCGATVESKAHEFGEWKTEIEPTKSEEGKKVRECKNCKHVESESIPVEKGSGAGLTFAIVIAAIVVADIIAFAVYWFVIQKKTFADIFSKAK